MIKIELIVGARPNFMKIAPIIHVIEKANKQKNVIKYCFIHTGPHQDANMRETFFQQLEIPKHVCNLNVGIGTQAEQTDGIMIRYEKLLLKEKIDLCIVVGDVTYTMACAIVARKLLVPVPHVEGGIRVVMKQCMRKLNEW